MANKARRPRPGRPATGHDPIRGVRLSDALVKKVAEWQYIHIERQNLTFSSAIRDLLTFALIKDGIIRKGDPLWPAS